MIEPTQEHVMNQGKTRGATGYALAALLPMLPLGIAVGWGLNRLVPQKYFAYVVYVLLIVTGVDLVLK